jgi:outer membrane lipoprotein LolB
MAARDVRARLAAGACLLVVLLGGCAPAVSTRSEDATSVGPGKALPDFAVAGRLSARHGDDAFAAGFHWQHDPQRDVLDFTSPLGQTVAMLSGTDGNVELRSADGRVLTADSWPALTERGLGWPLPVDGLVFWIQGEPRPGARFAAERDVSGRLSVLRQDGWTIAFQSFSSEASGAGRPARMTLSYPEVELRVVIDSWQ